eukprot:11749140-Alexandrium_andersonii.AAC.1
MTVENYTLTQVVRAVNVAAQVAQGYMDVAREVMAFAALKHQREAVVFGGLPEGETAVSYTHLTLPTICSV